MDTAAVRHRPHTIESVTQDLVTNQLVVARPGRPYWSFGRLSSYLSVAGALLLGAYYAWSYGENTTISAHDYKARTERVLRTTPLIDGHNDLPYLLRIELKNKIQDGRFTFEDCTLLRTIQGCCP